MAKKITVNDDLDISDDPKLVAKVDAMMDPAVSEDAVSDSEASESDNLEPKVEIEETAQSGPPPLDIFADAPSAPPLESIDESPKQPKTKPKTKTDVKKVKTETAADRKVKDDKPTPKDEPVSLDIEPDVEDQATEPKVEETVKVKIKPQRPPEYDDPKTAQAIEDIVAEESDAVLSLIDANEAEKYQAAVDQDKHGHPIFWTLIALICLLAIAMALFLMFPSFANFVNSLHISSLGKHL